MLTLTLMLVLTLILILILMLTTGLRLMLRLELTIRKSRHAPCPYIDETQEGQMLLKPGRHHVAGIKRKKSKFSALQEAETLYTL